MLFRTGRSLNLKSAFFERTPLRLISLVIISVIASMTLFQIPAFPVCAAVEANATVVVSNANVRVAPGTLSQVIGTVTRGDRVALSELVTIKDDPNGYNS